MTNDQKTEFGLWGMKSAKKHKLVTEKQDKADKRSRNAETDLQNLICKWLKDQHIIFLSDFAAGLHLSPFLASIRSLQACEYKMPDLYIFLPQGLLIIEIKVKESDLFNKDGKTLKSEHVQLQYESLLKLRNFGHHADFGVGEYDIKTMVTQFQCGTLKYKDIERLRPLTTIEKNNLVADKFFEYNG